MFPVFRLFLLAVGGLFAVAVSVRADGAADSAGIAAITAARGGDWNQAYGQAGQSGDPLTQKIVRWLDYTRSNPGGRFPEIAGFIEENPDWPLRKTLKRRAEDAMASESDDTAADWLKRHPPVSGAGQARAAEIMINRGNVSAGAAALRTAWAEGDFTLTQERWPTVLECWAAICTAAIARIGLPPRRCAIQRARRRRSP